LGDITVLLELLSRQISFPSCQLTLGSFTQPSPRIIPKVAPTFEALYEDLEDDEKAFFDLLDRELEKVESFYIAREQEASRREHQLHRQLKELAEHRKIYHEIYPDGTMEWELSIGKIIPGGARPVSDFRARAAEALHFRRPFTSPTSTNRPTQANDQTTPNGLSNGDGKPVDDHKALRDAIVADKDHQTYNPERYLKYKKELRLAVLDFYRNLELIKNYRVGLA
jgi:hypothetical protein